LYLIFFPLTWFEIILFPAIAVSSGFLDLAGMSTPDALAGAISLAALLSLSRHSYWTYLWASILPLARPDYVLLSLLLGIYVFLLPSKRLGMAVVATSSMACMIAIRLGHGYGWLRAFNFKFITLSPFPADMIISSQVGQYLSWYYRCVEEVIQSALFIPIIVTSAMIWRLYPKDKLIVHSFLISLMFFAISLLVFPSYGAADYRRFAWFSALTFMTLIRTSTHQERLSPAALSSSYRD
jgi:hypothetical protein